MKIGLVGYGSMSAALGHRWQGLGHELFVGGRDADKAAALAEQLNAGHGSAAEAVAFGDVVFLGLAHGAVHPTLDALGPGAFAGKVVIDPNNPVNIQDFSRTVPYEPSFAETIQQKLPGAHVVKAFNMCEAKVWAKPGTSDQPLTVFLCGDAQPAKDTVARLIAPLGYRPMDVGGLERAVWLEAAASLVIYLLFNGHPRETVLNLNVMN